MTDSPCCTDTLKLILSDRDKSHLPQDTSVNQSSIGHGSHLVEVFVYLFYFLDPSTLSGGKREAIQENKLTVELWSSIVPGKKKRGDILASRVSEAISAKAEEVTLP